jgi:hypothetical protein
LSPSTPGRPGTVRFYDWGGAVMAHFFAAMLVPRPGRETGLRSAPAPPELARIRAAYLHMFNGLAPHDQLVATLELACRVGKIARALT